MELDDGHGNRGGQIEDQVLQLRKQERETKIYIYQGQGIDRKFCFTNHDTIEGVNGFRIDSCTIKRGDLRVNTVI